MIYPEAEQGKQRDSELRKKLTMLGKTEEAGGVRLRQARAVLRHSRGLAEDVVAARKSLDVAKNLQETWGFTSRRLR